MTENIYSGIYYHDHVCIAREMLLDQSLKVPEKLQLYGLYVHYVVHICDFGMLRVFQTARRIEKSVN